MSKKRKIVLGCGAAVVLAVLVLVNLHARRGNRTDVQVSEVIRRNVTKVITASGEIQPKRRVNVSARTIGKVTKLAVHEGDRVRKGDFLLEIDAEPYETALDQLSAGVRGAQASVELESAALQKAQYDYDHAKELSESGFLSESELKAATSALEMAQARAKSADEALLQAEGSVRKAKHDLREVRITAEMSGVITGLNVEEGESAIMGTINNAGTALLTIADLSAIDAEVRVDETEVVLVRIGQPARVRLDAQPDTTYRGVVTEVGNSAIRTQAGMGQESVDFKVVVAISDSIPHVRPGLSASVDITVAEEKQVLAVPIQCLTVRDEARLRRERARHAGKHGAAADTAAADTSAADTSDTEDRRKRDIEGVFVVEKDVAHFRPVRVGIAGQSHFVVQSGLALGEKIVSGPFKVISDLKDGDSVKIKAEPKRRP